MRHSNRSSEGEFEEARTQNIFTASSSPLMLTAELGSPESHAGVVWWALKFHLGMRMHLSRRLPSGKESTCQGAGGAEEARGRSDSWVREVPGVGNDSPLSILAEKLPWTEELAVYCPQGCKEWDRTEHTCTHTHHRSVTRRCVFIITCEAYRILS